MRLKKIAARQELKSALKKAYKKGVTKRRNSEYDRTDNRGSRHRMIEIKNLTKNLIQM